MHAIHPLRVSPCISQRNLSRVQIVKQKSSQGAQDKVGTIIEKLVHDYAKSSSANHRKVRAPAAQNHHPRVTHTQPLQHAA